MGNVIPIECVFILKLRKGKYKMKKYTSRKKYLLSSILCCMVLGSASYGGENLIKNGSFEKHRGSEKSRKVKRVTMRPWHGTAEVWRNGFGKQATQGEYKIELDVGKKVDVLSQNVTTQKGREYKLSLDAYARKKNTSDFMLMVDGEVLSRVTPESSWNNYSVSFIGKGKKQRISLKEIDTQNNGSGAIIDNVKLEKMSTDTPPVEIDETEIDKTKPVITLNGSKNITLAFGAAYEEEGATAVDDKDGSVTVKIRGRVNTHKAKKYVIRYIAKDAAGNMRVVKRFVTVEKKLTDASGNTIKTLVLYDNSALNKYGTLARLKTRINHLFSVANQIYKDSKSPTRITPAAIVFNDPHTSNIAVALNKVMRSKEVARLRDKYKGDTVLQYQANTTGYGWCGRASRVSAYINPQSIKPYMFAEVIINCDDIVTTHEIGHNMGLIHSHKQDGNHVKPYNYGLGHGVMRKFSTLMTYGQVFAVRKTIAKFSSPEYECIPGYPCGIAVGEPGEAHATKVLEKTVPLIAKIYE